MTKLKTVLALLLVGVFMLSAVACNGNSGDTSDDITDVMNESDDNSSKPDSSAPVSDVAVRDPEYKSLNYDTIKGIWISQYDTAIFNPGNAVQRDKNNFKSRVEKICKAISESGFNTVVLQVRPFGDSYYPSELYPPSSFVVGSYGKDFKYDAFKIFIDIAHKYELSVHAWINPMRLMTEAEIQKISTDYVIGEWYQDEAKRNEHLYLYTDDNGTKRYYLIPGIEENRKLVADGAAEICRNYNVDAVHIDDYFYPTVSTAFDKAHYESVKDNYGSLSEYRLTMVNQLVKGIYKAVKEVDESILFGISPAGSIDNNMSSLFANVRLWGSKDGYCDYLAPQIYWGFEHPNSKQKFDLCTEDWAELCTNPNVKLVVGMGIYRANNPSATNSDTAEFAENKDVIKRQLEYLQNHEKVEGFIMYSFQDLFDDYGRDRRPLEAERANFAQILKDFE